MMKVLGMLCGLPVCLEYYRYCKLGGVWVSDDSDDVHVSLCFFLCFFQALSSSLSRDSLNSLFDLRALLQPGGLPPPSSIASSSGGPGSRRDSRQQQAGGANSLGRL